MVIYVFVVCICIYGLSISESLFVNLHDTECSILKFVNEVIDGETKTTLPKWGGATRIQNILNSVGNTIKNLDDSMVQGLTNSANTIATKKSDFETSLNDDSSYVLANHKDSIGSSPVYQLEIVQNFDSILRPSWQAEYTTISGQMENIRNTISSNFGNINSQKVDFSTKINSAGDEISNLRSSFDEIKSSIADVIMDLSDYIDTYGKLAFKITFSILMVISLAIAVFMSLQMFFRISECNNCFIKCLLKFFVHILWNILALLTICTLLIGGIFTLLGEAGQDLIYVFKYLISDENLKKDEPILITGDARNYLGKCVNGDGNITSELNIDLSSINNIENLRTSSSDFALFKDTIKGLKENKTSYNTYNGKIKHLITLIMENLTKLFLMKKISML